MIRDDFSSNAVPGTRQLSCGVWISCCWYHLSYQFTNAKFSSDRDPSDFLLQRAGDKIRRSKHLSYYPCGFRSVFCQPIVDHTTCRKILFTVRMMPYRFDRSHFVPVRPRLADRTLQASTLMMCDFRNEEMKNKFEVYTYTHEYVFCLTKHWNPGIMYIFSSQSHEARNNSDSWCSSQYDAVLHLFRKKTQDIS